MDFYKGALCIFIRFTIPRTLSWSNGVIIRTKMFKGWMFLIKSIKAQVVLIRILLKQLHLNLLSLLIIK
jgi:hypothetical protein